MPSAYVSIVVAGSGVVVRHFIFPGNSTYGFVASIFIAILLIYIKRNNKYFS